MKILTVVGARPQFIKAAVISRLAEEQADVEELLVHTGQHYDSAMSDVFFQELHLPQATLNLNIGSGSHAVQTGKMLIAIEEVLQQNKPDVVIVYGDTNSTIAAALAAAKLEIPVAHIEAGLRSFDRSMPEEINRCVTDHLSQWHFCPTDTAVANLKNEGITQNVFQVGDVMYDALLFYRDADSDQLPEILRQAELDDRQYALCTLHRAGNTDDPSHFRSLWESVNLLAEELPIVFPVHPRTCKVVKSLGLSTHPNLHLIDPVGYIEMLALERRAQVIVTDSGGVQKESYMQGVPCLTLRTNTEWTETVDTGWNRLVAPDTLVEEARKVLQGDVPTDRPELYGDGHAGEKILEILKAA